MLADRRVGLLIAEADKPSRNPLSMARVSIQGEVEPLEADSVEFDRARDLHIGAHPTAAFNFELGDFRLIRIRPTSARFIAGVGRIVDVTAEDWAGLTLRS